MNPIPDVKELRLAMRVTNNRILNRREALGLTVEKAASLAGISMHTWYMLQSLNYSPLLSRGAKEKKIEWKPSAIAMARTLGVTPEWLWPESVLSIVKSSLVIEIDASELAPQLTSVQMRETPLLPSARIEDQEQTSSLERAMEGLYPIERKILRMRMGYDEESPDGLNLQQVGDRFGLSRERIRQIEMRGLAKLRKALKALDIDTDRGAFRGDEGEPSAWHWCPKCTTWTRDVETSEGYGCAEYRCKKCNSRCRPRP